MRSIIIIFFITLLINSCIYAEIIKVPEDFSTIQNAIYASTEGDVVLVNNGIYSENIEIDSKKIFILSKNGLGNVTIDGNYSGSILNIVNGANVSIAGIIFTKGSGEFLDLNGNGMYFTYGGAINVVNSHLSVFNCEFDENISGYTSDNQNGGGYGGAISLYKSDLSVEASRFASNKAWYPGGGFGGAIYAWDNCGISLNNCEFFQNSSGASGGAIALTDVSSISAYWCSFINNHSGTGQIPLLGTGGAIVSDYYIDQQYINCTFSNNTSDYQGPVIYARRFSNIMLVNSNIWDNGSLPIEFDYNYGINNILIEHCNLQNGQSSIQLNDNANLLYTNSFSADPKFAASGTTHNISSDSPCIDAGLVSFEYQDSPIFEYNPDQYSGSSSDVGSYEYGLSDNLPLQVPDIPSGLTYEVPFNGQYVTLNWRKNKESDFAYYKLYRNDELYGVTFDSNYTDNSVIESNYSYKISAVNYFGNEGEKSNAVNVIVGVEDEANMPLLFSLKQNYPNPFNPTTSIEYSVPGSEYVSLKVHDVLGKEIAVLVNQHMNAGNYSVTFNASNLSSGIYFYTLTSGNQNLTRKMLLLR